MAAKLTPAQREDAILKAWQMSLRGATTTKIGQELGISAKGIGRLLKTARDRAQRQNEGHMDAYLAEFIGEQRAVMEAAWIKVEKTRDSAIVQGNLFAVISTASKHIATARGVFVERTDITSKGAAIAWTDLVRQIEAEDKQARTPQPAPDPTLSESDVAVGHG
jgi:hypothetical protein